MSSGPSYHIGGRVAIPYISGKNGQVIYTHHLAPLSGFVYSSVESSAGYIREGCIKHWDSELDLEAQQLAYGPIMDSLDWTLGSKRFCSHVLRLQLRW